jgi:predicted ATP-dependent endonuclease of OLD family
MAPRLNAFIVKNYRSIEAPVKIRLPQTGPLVLLGENNAGKSNLTRALDILLGERWPGTITLEDGHSSDLLVSGLCGHCVMRVRTCSPISTPR